MRGWLGLGEVGGNNTGWFVRFLTKGQNGAWCAALSYSAYELAFRILGQEPPIKRTHLARKLYSRIKEYGRAVEVHEADIGDLVCFSRPEAGPWAGHCGIVVGQLQPGVVRVVDGNIGSYKKTKGRVREYEVDLRLKKKAGKLVGIARL